MRTLMVWSMMIMSTTCSFGQKHRTVKNHDDILSATAELNCLLSYYDTLSPFTDDQNNFEIIDSVNSLITTKLLTILNDPRIKNYEIDTLLNTQLISVSRSPDRRIHFFSIDAKTGGSYRTSKTIIQYERPDGSLKAEFTGNDESEAIATSVYGQVYILDSIAHKYFVISEVITFNTCIATMAWAITPDSDSFHPELIVQYDGRYDDLITFKYDPREKEILYEYRAASNDDSLYGGDHDLEGFEHKYHSRFKYVSGAFHELEKCEYLDKAE